MVARSTVWRSARRTASAPGPGLLAHYPAGCEPMMAFEADRMTGLVLTDANVLLGKVQPRHFPAVFGPAGEVRCPSEGRQRMAMGEVVTEPRRHGTGLRSNYLTSNGR